MGYVSTHRDGRAWPHNDIDPLRPDFAVKFADLEHNQLGQWLPKADARLVRGTGARPADPLAADAATIPGC